jgi:hypothetical protein
MIYEFFKNINRRYILEDDRVLNIHGQLDLVTCSGSGHMENLKAT